MYSSLPCKDCVASGMSILLLSNIFWQTRQYCLWYLGFFIISYISILCICLSIIVYAFFLYTTGWWTNRQTERQTLNCKKLLLPLKIPTGRQNTLDQYPSNIYDITSAQHAVLLILYFSPLWIILKFPQIHITLLV